MRLKIAVIICALALQACGTMKFQPTEYPLRDGLIPTFDVAGTVSVSNAQPSTEPSILYSYMGMKLASDLKSVTEVMVQQTVSELAKNGHNVGGNSKKTIDLKVNSLVSRYTYAFFYKSRLQFQATLGNGVVIETLVPHASGIVQQDLNGCIAESVMVLLKDERVRSYLAQ